MKHHETLKKKHVAITFTTRDFVHQRRPTVKFSIRHKNPVSWESMGSETVTAKTPPFKRSEVHQFQEWPDKLSDKALVRFCILDFFDKNDWLVATQIFFIFTPKIGGDAPILTNLFQMGWFNHQLDENIIEIEGMLMLFLICKYYISIHGRC